MLCISFISTHCLSLLKILYFSSSIHGEVIFSITMGCHLAFLSQPVSPAKDSPPWSIILVWRGTWLSQMDFHLHWSTTTKALCHRYKATSLSETTHSSFVFLLHSLHIMFHTLFSMALQMGNFKGRVLLKIIRKKKHHPENYWALYSSSMQFPQEFCFSRVQMVYAPPIWAIWVIERRSERKEAKHQHRKVPRNQLSQTLFHSAEKTLSKGVGCQDLPLLDDLATKEGRGLWTCSDRGHEGGSKSTELLLHTRD